MTKSMVGVRASPSAWRGAVAVTIALTLCADGHAATYVVGNTQNAGAGSLRQAILDANASGAHAGVVSGANTIDVTASGTIALADALPLLFSNVTINGNGVTIDGGGAHRCLFASGLPLTPTGDPQAITVALNQLQLNHCVAKGGDGGTAGFAGGGGLGAGGALFVGVNADVTLNSVSFDGNQAVGGNGGDSSPVLAGYGGGGGLGGNGGDAVTEKSYGGGGGMGAGADGGSAYCIELAGGGGGGIGGSGGSVDIDRFGGGGGGGFGGSGLGQISSNQGFAAGGDSESGQGGANGGGGNGGDGGASGDTGQASGAGGAGGANGADGGAGGGGGSGALAYAGGAGGGGGGGGGLPFMGAGPAGFGGGSGGGGVAAKAGFGGGGGRGTIAGFGGGAALTGQAGFGGGGGGGAGVGGFGGGNGGSTLGNSAGGGGGAMGAAVFVAPAGHLMIGGSGVVSNHTTVGGNGGVAYDGGDGGSAGSGFGAALFLAGSGTLDVAAGAGSYTINDDLADATGSGAVSGDAGSWGINVHNGTLLLTGNSTLSGPITVGAGGALVLDGSATGNDVTIVAGGTLTGSLYQRLGAVSNAGTFAPLLISDPGQVPIAMNLISYTGSTGSTLRVTVDGKGGYSRIAVGGAMTAAGTLDFDFATSPAPGTAFTIADVHGALSGTFSGYSSNLPSMYGEIVYVNNATPADGAPSSLQFTVIANDLIFRSGFEAAGVAGSGSCRYGAIDKQQFAAIPASLFDGLAVCIPPVSVSDTIDFGILGNLTGTLNVCQTSMCSATVAGCATTLHASTPNLTGAVTGGMYTIDTPAIADDTPVPVSFTAGGLGTVACTASASGISAHIVASYLVDADSLNGAYVDALYSDQVTALSANLSGCDPYGELLPYAQTQLAPLLQIQLTEYINGLLPKPGAPGEGDTICPAQ